MATTGIKSVPSSQQEVDFQQQHLCTTSSRFPTAKPVLGHYQMQHRRGKAPLLMNLLQKIVRPGLMIGYQHYSVLAVGMVGLKMSH